MGSMKAGLVQVVMLAALSGCGPDAAVRSTSGPTAIPDRFHALGTEPFWGLTVTGIDARYATPEIPEEIARDVVRSTSSGVETVSGRLGQLPFRLTVRPERCSDGMSDRVYPFAAELRVGGQTLRGCAAAK